jgi:isopentenyl-diphosphate Delta-isomerase
MMNNNLQNNIILIDENDKPIGSAEKLWVHQNGALHRAFSILIYNPKGQMLLQQRALSKYHSGGLWSNTCCGHPQPNFSIEDEAHKRLIFEMGFDCNLSFDFKFQYKTILPNGLIEHELDYVYSGVYSGKVQPNKDEVESYRWCDLNILKQDITQNIQNYTYWFKEISKYIN